MMQNESSTNLKWNQHPVIGMLFWAFGTAEAKNKNSNSSKDPLNQDKSSSERIFFEDTFKEYLQTVQSTSTAATTPNKEEIYHLEQHWNKYVTYEQSFPKLYPDTPNEMTTTSPQWGFFVPITPNLQELYGKTTASPNSMPSNERYGRGTKH
jgi:hypothetical protein